MGVGGGLEGRCGLGVWGKERVWGGGLGVAVWGRRFGFISALTILSLARKVKTGVYTSIHK